MTLPQIFAVSIFVIVMALMVWGRLRYDLVACIGLMAGIGVGIVPYKDAFKGFSDDIVIIVASALVISAGVARSGILVSLLRLVTPYLKSTQSQVIVLVTAVGVLSAIVKNIGALAMLLPIAFQFARRSGQSPSVFLMPMAFASLLGGIVTLVGTSPNVIVARVRGEITGEPFEMFDFTPVGILIAAAGIAFLCVGYRLLPRNRQGAGGLSDALESKDYVTEARVGEKSPMIGKTISDLMGRAEPGVTLISLISGKRQPVALFPDVEIDEGDILLFRGEQGALDNLVKEAGLLLEGDDRPTESEKSAGKSMSIEVVIAPDSILIGSGAGLANLHQRYGINLLAVGRSGEKLNQRLRDIQLRMGDTLVIRGAERSLTENLVELGLLPLAARTITLGEARRGWVALSILAVAIVLLAMNLLPVALTLFGAAGLMILLGALPVREAYDKIEWPILIMFAALIPLSDSLSTTGTTKLIADGLSVAGANLPPWGALALVMAGSMAVTPFLNNAATVLVVAPIGAVYAKTLGYNIDPFLMAVAIGAACDFLTPIGHQCNTLVMGPGGYKFIDYPRLGAPLSLLVLVLGVPLIMIFWPLK